VRSRSLLTAKARRPGHLVTRLEFSILAYKTAALVKACNEGINGPQKMTTMMRMAMGTWASEARNNFVRITRML
jgi:hypothetical protein